MFVTSRTTCGGHDYTLVYFLVKTERINTPPEYEITPPRGHSLDRFAVVTIVIIEQFIKYRRK